MNFRNIGIVLLCVVFLSCSQRSSDEVAINDKWDFDNYFELVDSVQISNYQEIISITSVTEYNDKLFIADQSQNKILIFDSEGLTGSFGGTGSGPGEFRSLDWVFADDDQIIARDGQGNLKYHFFDLNGEYKTSVFIPSTPPFTQAFLSRYDNEPAIISSGLASCTDSSSEICTIFIQNYEGDILQSMAPNKEVEPNAIGVPYLIAHSRELDEYFAAHVHGTGINRYNSEGELIRRIDITTSPFTNPLDKNNIERDDLQKMYRQITTSSKTIVSYVAADKGNVVIQFSRSGSEYEGQSKNFIEIYDVNGTARALGIDTDIQLIKYEKGNFIFKKNIPNSEGGGYGIYIYTLK